MTGLRTPTLIALGLMTTGLAAAIPVHASCGAAFCNVNTQWETQGTWTGEGLRLGLRYEYTDQDQLRRGSDKVQPAGVLGTHDELHTLNRNLLVSADYAMNRDWALALQIPVVQREHRHIHNDIVPELETWNLTGLGDVRLLARRQSGLSEQAAAGVQFGIKLPTGSIAERNDTGELAERSLQPGSGTTDALLGAYYYRKLEGDATTLFTQFMVQVPFGEHDGYAPGSQAMLDVGLRYALTLDTSALLQLNLHWKDCDSGAEAEPDESGGTFVNVSPGVSHLFTPRLQLYGFVQLPLYRYVNGTQLTADWSAVLGMSWKM